MQLSARLNNFYLLRRAFYSTAYSQKLLFRKLELELENSRIRNLEFLEREMSQLLLASYYKRIQLYFDHIAKGLWINEFIRTFLVPFFRFALNLVSPFSFCLSHFNFQHSTSYIRPFVSSIRPFILSLSTFCFIDQSSLYLCSSHRFYLFTFTNHLSLFILSAYLTSQLLSFPPSCQNSPDRAYALQISYSAVYPLSNPSRPVPSRPKARTQYKLGGRLINRVVKTNV